MKPRPEFLYFISGHNLRGSVFKSRPMTLTDCYRWLKETSDRIMQRKQGVIFGIPKDGHPRKIITWYFITGPTSNIPPYVGWKQ